ncbi:hypothetical protein L9F63_002277, partial [Diploptera punctata]
IDLIWCSQLDSNIVCWSHYEVMTQREDVLKFGRAAFGRCRRNDWPSRRKRSPNG